MKIGNVLVLRGVARSGVDDVGLLRQHVGCNSSRAVDSAVVVVSRLGVGESRRKGQSECGVGVHDAW